MRFPRLLEWQKSMRTARRTALLQGSCKIAASSQQKQVRSRKTVFDQITVFNNLSLFDYKDFHSI